jgi:hypothetical protein
MSFAARVLDWVAPNDVPSEQEKQYRGVGNGTKPSYRDLIQGAVRLDIKVAMDVMFPRKSVRTRILIESAAVLQCSVYVV